jgi:hypothetical protein
VGVGAGHARPAGGDDVAVVIPAHLMAQHSKQQQAVVVLKTSHTMMHYTKDH